MKRLPFRLKSDLAMTQTERSPADNEFEPQSIYRLHRETFFWTMNTADLAPFSKFLCANSGAICLRSEME